MAVSVAKPIDDRALGRMGLGDFETRADCARRQAEMIARLQFAGYDASQLRELNKCGEGICPIDRCTEGCHFATRNRRLRGIQSAVDIFQTHVGPLYEVCIVHPLWQRPVGRLADSNIPAAVQWIRRRLSDVVAPDVVAVGTFEVSLNRELDGELYWAGEVHQVIAGASQSDLKQAFAIELRYRDRRPGDKLLHVVPVENLLRTVAYAQKRFVEERRAYVSASTGRQARRHLPLKPKHSAEHDAWLLSLPIGARTIVFGCGRHGSTFVARS